MEISADRKNYSHTLKEKGEILTLFQTELRLLRPYWWMNKKVLSSGGNSPR